MPDAFARSCEIKIDALDGVNGWSPSEASEKTKEIYDQRAPVTRYYLIKELAWSLDIKYYLVPEGLSSVTKPSNNCGYQLCWSCFFGKAQLENALLLGIYSVQGRRQWGRGLWGSCPPVFYEIIINS